MAFQLNLARNVVEWGHMLEATTLTTAGSVLERLHQGLDSKNTLKNKMDLITKTLNEIMNAKKAGKSELTVSPVSKLLFKVLDLMKGEGYIDYKIQKGKFDKAIISINRVNECRSIRPRLHFQKDELEKYLRRYLPSRDLGVVIVSTDEGIMVHRDAAKSGLGGVLLAYTY